jgi:PAS domain S-box-containing protein
MPQHWSGARSPGRDESPTWPRALGTALAVALLYFAAAKIGLGFISKTEGIAIIWPAAGVLFGALLATRRSSWAFIVPAAFAALTLANLSAGDSLAFSLGLSAANCSESVLAATAILWFLGHPPQIDVARDTSAVMLAGVVGTNALTALLGAAVMHVKTDVGFWRSWLMWAIEHGLGMLMVAPVVLELHRVVMTPSAWKRRPSGEAAAFGAGLALISVWVFMNGPLSTYGHFAKPYLLFPIVYYAALRLGPRGVVVSCLWIAILGIWGVASSAGPFHDSPRSLFDESLATQVFLAVLVGTGWLLAAFAMERVRMEDALLESRNTLRSFYDSSPMSMGVAELDGKDNFFFVAVNAATSRFLGATPDQMRGRSPLEFGATPELIQRWIKYYRQSQREGVPVQYEYQRPPAAGSRWMSVTAAFVGPGPNGRLRFSFVSEDITERRLAEQALHESEEKYRAIFENETYAICVFDQASLRFLDVNAAWERMYGYAREELLSGMVVPDLAAEPTESRTVVADAVRRGSLFAPLRQHRRKDGTTFPSELVLGSFQWRGKSAMFALVNDISARRDAEIRVEQLLDEQESILNTSPVGISLIRDRAVVWANPAQDRMLGGPTAGMETAAFYASPDEHQMIGRHGYAALARGETYRTEVEMRRTSGDTFWCALSARFVDPSKPESGVIAVVEDVTDKKRVEDQLRAYAETQHTLLREVNHRVKNNLSAILGMLHLEHMRAAASSHRHEVRVLDDMEHRIRALATVHQMLSAGEWQPVRLRDLCAGILANIFTAAKLPAQRLRIDESAVLVGPEQAHRLALVLSELATNTAKYGSGPKGPDVEVGIEDRGTSIAMTYRDHGAGFPNAILERTEGAGGIGLELVRGIVSQSLRGSTSFSNDGGAVVTMDFPKMTTGDTTHVH